MQTTGKTAFLQFGRRAPTQNKGPVLSLHSLYAKQGSYFLCTDLGVNEKGSNFASSVSFDGGNRVVSRNVRLRNSPGGVGKFARRGDPGLKDPATWSLLSISRYRNGRPRGKIQARRREILLTAGVTDVEDASY